MKILGINFGGQPQKVRTAPQAMNTPFLKIGKGNLSLPYVQSAYTSNNVIYFGSDNLFPQLLNQMYFTSALHSSIIDFTVNAVMGGGVEVTPKQDTSEGRIDSKVFKSRYKIDKLFRILTRDYYMHSRCHILLKFSDNGGKLLQMRRIDPSQIRYRTDGRFEYCEDWSNNRGRQTFDPYDPAYPTGHQLLTMQDESPGQDYYPIPGYSAALNWCFLDGEQSFLHKSNIQNSIFPSVFIRRPKRFGTQKEIEDFKDGLSTAKGAANAGYVGVLTGDGFENTPEVVQYNSNQNDKLFTQTDKSIQDNICFSHKINPSIMGIKVAGSLGNAQELEMSYNIWEKNVVLPLRELMEELGDKLLQIADQTANFDIVGYRIIEETIKEEPIKKPE